TDARDARDVHPGPGDRRAEQHRQRRARQRPGEHARREGGGDHEARPPDRPEPVERTRSRGRRGHDRPSRSAATTPPPTRTTAPRIQGQIGVPPFSPPAPPPSAGGAAAGAGSDAGADAGASAPAPGPGVVSVNDTSPETG